MAACAALRYASTLCPITISNARAVRVGRLRPCSQPRNVPMLTPHMLAKVSCPKPHAARMARASSSRGGGGTFQGSISKSSIKADLGHAVGNPFTDTWIWPRDAESGFVVLHDIVYFHLNFVQHARIVMAVGHVFEPLVSELVILAVAFRIEQRLLDLPTATSMNVEKP